MITPPSNDDLHLLTGAYVVNALDDIERRRFELHLSSCESCRDEVESLRSIVDDLAGTTIADPPASLKAAVLTEIGQTRQISSVRKVAAAPGRSGRSLRWLATVAAALVALGLGGFALQQRTRANSYQTAAEIVRAPDARIIRLSGTNGSAQLTYSSSIRAGVLVADGLSPAPTGRAYQAWAIEGGAARSLGTFTTRAGRSVAVPVRTALATDAIVAVTEEPAGGSAQPTSAPFLASA